MNTQVNRRSFLRSATTASLLLAGGGFGIGPVARAIAPIERTGSARLLLSVAAYSFRDSFKDNVHKPAASSAKKIDLFDFIDYCADHGCQGTELTSYYFPAQLTDEYLLQLKRRAFLRGIAVSGTAVGNDFTVVAPEKRRQEIESVKRWIDRAQVLGAPHIRVFAGSGKGLGKEEAKKRAIDALQESCQYAGQKGIYLGLENHGGIVAEPDDLLDIVQAVQSPWFGVNLDTGNFQTADPYADLARCAPYAVNVQIKTEVHPKGQGTQPADLPRLVKILRDARYQGYVALEYEAAEDPWQAVPRTLKQLQALF